MRVLLDTHTFLWYIEGSPQLPGTARRLIERRNVERLISVACVWEMAIKVSIGRLESEAPFAVSVRRMLEHNRIELLHPTLDDLDLVATLPFHHRDPFDRMMIAQSLSQQIPIVSGDLVFDEYGVDRRW
jgi:PIN domain nuclease of toxin-antitoxin system